MPPHTRARCLPRYWLTRLYVGTSVLVNVAITTGEPHALGYRVLTQAGDIGWVCMYALGALAVLALADVMVNDLLPARYSLPTAQRWRHLVYMGLAMGLVSYTGVLVNAVQFTPLVYTYWLDASVCVAIAFFDLFSRLGGRTA